MYLHRISNLIDQEFALVKPSVKVTKFSSLTKLKIDLVVHQNLETIHHNVYISNQIARHPKHNEKFSYFEQDLTNCSARVYCKWKSKSLLDKNVLNLYKNTFKARIRNQTFIWSGGKGTFFGIHKDSSDELVLNYVVYGMKKWWIIKKSKEKMFR